MITISDAYTQRYFNWTDWKTHQTEKSLIWQLKTESDTYWIWGYDGPECFITQIWTGSVPDVIIDAGYTQEQNDSDKTDFETNYKSGANKSILIGLTNVTTQYEKNDKDLRLAKIKVTIIDGIGEVRLKIPGTFGNDNDGRWIAGGDGWMDSYDPDDYLKVSCSDDDRLISAAYGGLTDEQMQANGFPSYPMVKDYTDDDYEEENQGWYFWALATGGTTPAVGEIEFEPIAGYGHIPSGMYLVITLIRPNVQTGTFRGNIFWGKKE